MSLTEPMVVRDTCTIRTFCSARSVAALVLLTSRASPSNASKWRDDTAPVLDPGARKLLQYLPRIRPRQATGMGGYKWQASQEDYSTVTRKNMNGERGN